MRDLTQGRFRADRRRPAADDLPPSRWSICRCSAPTRRSRGQRRSSRTCETNLEEFNGRVILHRARRSADRLPALAARVKAAAQQFVAPLRRRQRSRRRRAHRQRRQERAGVHQQPAPGCSRRSTSSPARRSRRRRSPSSTTTTAARHGHRPGRARHDGRGTCAQGAQHARPRSAPPPDFLGNVRGRRKAVVWFGEGIDYDIDERVRDRIGDARSCDEMRDTIAAATRAGVSFYGVDARGVGAGLDETIDIGSLPSTIRRQARARRAVWTRCAARRTSCGRCRPRPAGSRSSTRTI